MYNHPVADLEINKNVLSISHFHDPSDDEFWHAASPLERLAPVQIHREAAYGKTAASARLQRVLEITEAPTALNTSSWAVMPSLIMAIRASPLI